MTAGAAPPRATTRCRAAPAGSCRRRRRPIDLHTHTTRSDGVLAPAELVRPASDAGVRLLRADRPRHARRLSRGRRRRRRARPDLTLIPGVEINAIVTRDLGLWEGELHILGLRDGPGRRGVRGGAGGPARRAGASGSSGRSPACARSACRSTTSVADSRTPATTTPSAGRPIARALDRGRVRRRASRTRSRGCSAGASPATCRASGLGPGRGDPGHPRGRRAAGPGPLPRGARRASTSSRELVDAGLGGLEVYYRSFDAATVVAVGEVAAALGLVRDRRHATTTATSGTYAEAHAGLWVPPEVAAAGARWRAGVVATGRPDATDRDRRPSAGASGSASSFTKVGRSSTGGLPPPPGPQVERLDEDAEAHRRVDVRLVDVEPEPVGDQRDADQQQERQREHLDRRVVVDEASTAAPTRRASPRPR